MFNCTGFSAIAYQAFAPPSVTETGTHYLLYANTVLYILEKPKPASTAPQGSTTPSGQPPMNAATPQNNTPTIQPPASTITPQNSTLLSNSTMPASSTLNTQQNATQPQPASPKQNTSQGPSTLLAIPIAFLAALAFLG
jgi:hypothetical protein